MFRIEILWGRGGAFPDRILKKPNIFPLRIKKILPGVFLKRKNDFSPTISLCGGRLNEWDFGLLYGVLAADTKLGLLPV